MIQPSTERDGFEYTVIVEIDNGYAADNHYGDAQRGINLRRFHPTSSVMWRRQFGHVLFSYRSEGTLIGIEEGTLRDEDAKKKCLEILLRLPNVAKHREHWLKEMGTTEFRRISKP